MNRKTVALKYDSGKDDAPYVVAKGQRLLADKILEVARDFGIPVYKDGALASVLYRLAVGDVIPEEFYVVVATVIAWVYSMDKGRRAKGKVSSSRRQGRYGR